MYKTKIALLIPICSRKRNYKLDNYPLKRYLLSSLDFENEYEYEIFLGSDHNDLFYLKPEVKKDIDSLPNVSIRYYNDTANNPVRVWNYLFKTAYDKGFDYFYQLGDDIEIITKNSITSFIKTLKEMNNIGVAGPLDTNNPNLLTQSFVHKTHMNIFGFYYPHEFTNWHCDNWIQEVYKPDRMKKLKEVSVRNSGGPARYQIQGRGDYMKFVERDKQILYNYIHGNS